MPTFLLCDVPVTPMFENPLTLVDNAASDSELLRRALGASEKNTTVDVQCQRFLGSLPDPAPRLSRWSAPVGRSFHMKRLVGRIISAPSAAMHAALIIATMLSILPTTVPAQSQWATTERASDANESPASTSTPSSDRRNIETNTPVESFRPMRIEVEVERLVEIETQRQLNEAYHRLLDNQADAIDRWLMFITLGLGIFTFLAAFVGYIGFNRFREIEVEAKENVARAATHAEDAERFVGEIRKNRDRSEEMLRNQTAESADESPEETKRSSNEVLESLQASPLAKVIARALSFQAKGRKEEAIKKWRSIAIVAEESNSNLAARAWFSVGYLLSDTDQKEAIEAFDEAIFRDPYYDRAFHHRGALKADIGRIEDAVIDFDEAIRLAPNDPLPYSSRGFAKLKLDLKDDARKDFSASLSLARKTGHAELAMEMQQRLDHLAGSQG